MVQTRLLLTTDSDSELFQRLKARVRTHGGIDLAAEMRTSDPVETLLAVENYQPDLLVMFSENAAVPGICSHLLDQNPHMALIVVPRYQKPLLLTRETLVQELDSATEEEILTAIQNLRTSR